MCGLEAGGRGSSALRLDTGLRLNSPLSDKGCRLAFVRKRMWKWDDQLEERAASAVASRASRIGRERALWDLVRPKVSE